MTPSRFLLFVSLTLLVNGFCSAQVRKKESINEHWLFLKGDYPVETILKKGIPGKVVNIPHTWNQKDVLSDGERGYYRGTGWYQKKLLFTPDTKLKNYFLHFEGVNQIAEVYINGLLAGTHVGGYSAFTIDITPFLNKNNNTMHVMVSNAHNPDVPPLSADFTFFGGIYRDVYLVETHKTHFTMGDYGSKGLYVSTPKITENVASVELKGTIVHTGNTTGAEVFFRVFDQQMNEVSSIKEPVKLNNGSNLFSTFLQIKSPKLWSPDNPTLYRAIVSIIKNGKIIDEEILPLGIRSFHFDPEKGFFLNGTPLKLIGANRHQDYLGYGNALEDDLHRSDLRLLKNMGANFIRLAHYPQDPTVLEEADRLGLLVWEETPLVNELTNSEAHAQNAETMLKEMIRQHYNHPSVILWGYMNEIYWAHRFLPDSLVNTQTEATVKLAKKLENVARKEDPTRYTAMALHNYPLYEESGIAGISQVTGWNLYHGWYYDTYTDFGKFMDEQHKKYPDRVHFISEFGAGSDPRLHSLNPEKFDFTVEGHKKMMESFLNQILERPYIAGASVWNLIDFSSERRIDTNPHINNKGLSTYNRVPKDPYFWFQANLLKTPFVKIAETNWKYREGYSANGNDPIVYPIEVYSNAEETELFLNGVSLGTKLVKNRKAVWEVSLPEGSNQLTALAKNKVKTIAKDHLSIQFKEIPFFLEKENFVDISINAGSNHSFHDVVNNVVWVEDKPYQKGSWGYLGGEMLYVGGKIGTKEEILTVYNQVPLYQTMREGSKGYQFDVKDGWYELELLFAEPYPKSRRFVDGEESPYHEGGIRVFDVVVNGETVFTELDLLKEYGYNYPLRKKIRVKVEKKQGLSVHFKSKVGKSIISAIRLRSL